MNDIVFNILSSQGPSIPERVPIIGGMPASTFAGSFLGVVFAILFGVLVDYLRKDASKFKHMKMLKKEIDQGIKVIKENRIRLDENRSLSVENDSNRIASIIPTDSWNSSIYIGVLRLFSSEERLELIKKYKLIGEFNCEINRYRDLKLNLVDMYNGEGFGPRTSACRRYEEVVLPLYYNDLQTNLEELSVFLEPKVIDRRWMFWRYIL